MGFYITVLLVVTSFFQYLIEFFSIFRVTKSQKHVLIDTKRSIKHLS